jgi:hypothetical protein
MSFDDKQSNRVGKPALKRLEPCAGKLACTVLRRGSSRKVASLSDYAQPYDISATGFYFETAEQYSEQVKTLKNEYGDPVEEFEIQFIDGEDIDSELSKAWDLNQLNFPRFLEVADEWNTHEKTVFIIAVGEAGYSFDHEHVAPSDFEVDIYELDSLKELAEQFVDEGLYGEIPESLQFYINTDAMARDLAVDYAQTIIAGTRLVYRSA